MHRALLALVAICGALAGSAVASAGATVQTDRDYTIEMQTGNFNPCTNANDLSVTFAGLTKVHVTAKVQGGIATSAHVDVDQSGVIATTLGGVTYLGYQTYSSKVNLNNQNAVMDVHSTVVAVALDGSGALVFDVENRATFNAKDSGDPVSTLSRTTIASCPS